MLKGHSIGKAASHCFRHFKNTCSRCVSHGLSFYLSQGVHFSFICLVFFPCSPDWPSPHRSLASAFSVLMFLECPTTVDLGGHPLIPHCSQDIALDVWMEPILFLFFVCAKACFICCLCMQCWMSVPGPSEN